MSIQNYLAPAVLQDPFIHLCANLNKSLSTSCLLAGGYLRDIYFDGWARDVDIFVHVPDNIVYSDEQFDSLFRLFKTAVINEVTQFLTNKGFIIYKQEESLFTFEIDNMINTTETRMLYHNPNILGISEILTGDLIQLIFIKMPPRQFVLEQFDVGLSKVFTDGRILHLSPEFRYDAEHNTITITKNITNTNAPVIEKYITKLKVYFPSARIRTTTQNIQNHQFLANAEVIDD